MARSNAALQDIASVLWQDKQLREGFLRAKSVLSVAFEQQCPMDLIVQLRDEFECKPSVEAQPTCDGLHLSGFFGKTSTLILAQEELNAIWVAAAVCF